MTGQIVPLDTSEGMARVMERRGRGRRERRSPIDSYTLYRPVDGRWNSLTAPRMRRVIFSTLISIMSPETLLSSERLKIDLSSHPWSPHPRLRPHSASHASSYPLFSVSIHTTLKLAMHAMFRPTGDLQHRPSKKSNRGSYFEHSPEFKCRSIPSI